MSNKSPGSSNFLINSNSSQLNSKSNYESSLNSQPGGVNATGQLYSNLTPNKVMNETTQMEWHDETQSVMNIHIASDLNENTFHVSPNEANFFSEQFEFQYKNKVNKLFLWSLNVSFRSFLIFCSLSLMKICWLVSPKTLPNSFKAFRTVLKKSNSRLIYIYIFMLNRILIELK